MVPVDYRPFRNTDPPQLVELWNRAGLGRGAADGLTAEAFEHVNFATPYFDPHGLIVACEGNEIHGFVHAGFGPDEDETGLVQDPGVICAVVVKPASRRQGIGRELVRRAEAYLQNGGARTFLAGPAPPHDPFYVGLYGGVEPAGFLDSDPAAVPFFRALGYEPHRHHLVFQRAIANGSDPVNMQLLNIRRKTQLAVYQGPSGKTWWWQARFGRFDYLRFVLVARKEDTVYASVTVLGLDFFLPKWEQRAVGLIDLHVPPEYRREGYGQALLTEVGRRLRQEMISLMETHTPAEEELTIALLQAAGFEQSDRGTVLKKTT